VYTFAANIATDINDVTNSPTTLMAMASGWGAAGMGEYIDFLALPGNPLVEGTLLESYQKDIIPFYADGWQTLSINYTPPLTAGWWGFLAAPYDEFTSADQTVLDGITTLEGWTGDESAVAKAALVMAARADRTGQFHVWIDNLRVYKSAYELDLGFEKTEFVQPADLTGLLPDFVPQPSGNIDGSFESYVDNLDAIGFVTEPGDGSIEPFQKASNCGPYPDNYGYGPGSAASVSVSSSVDHTKSAGSTKCLQVALSGTETTNLKNIRAWVDSAIVALPGSGIYCAEVFASKQRATNQFANDRTPTYVIALNQCGPNALATAYGAQLAGGGVPISVGEEENNWLRIVGTGYIADALLARASVQVSEAWDADVSNFDVQSYFDDIGIYRVDDPAKFFDADLFDNI